MTPFTKGLHELGDGVFAYLQPTGSWGYSNAGLVAADGTSLLVDTLFDLELTRAMLDAMRPVTQTRPIETLVNTHANGDHCWGNQLVPERAEIYTTVATAEEMRLVPPARIAALRQSDDDELRAWADYAFGDFSIDDVVPRFPDRTFTQSLSLSVGGRELEVTDLGPAHTLSDSIVHVPDAAVIFTGDLVFVKGTPIAWAGPISNWLRACDQICALGAALIVPGHGPVTDDEGVRQVQRYFEHVEREALERLRGGMPSVEAAFDIDLGEFSDLPDSERIVVTVDTIYREHDTALPPRDSAELSRQMLRYVRQSRSRTDRVARV